MKFEQELIDDLAIEKVNLKRATMNDSDEFKDVLFSNINSGVKNIIVDVAKCDFMDSSFLGAIVLGLKEATKHGGTLVLSGVHADTEVILDITGINKMIKIYENIEVAKAELYKNSS